MKIQVKVRLSFKKSVNQIIIKFNTYEKVTWDLYLATSISLHSENRVSAESYIDELTGNGSLNGYLKNLVESVNHLTDEEKRKVLESNLYPVLKVDSTNYYEYYPELDQSIINGKTENGNIGEVINIHKMLMSDPKGTFHSSSIISGEIKKNENVYNVKIQDSLIMVELVKHKWISISELTFKELVSVEVKEIDYYDGLVYDKPEGDSWNILTNSMINNIKSATTFFYHNGDFHMITNEGVKQIQIGRIYGIYIYSEKTFLYTKENLEICEIVLNQLISSKNINTFKTKPLVQLLYSVSQDLAQEVINYVLHRKNSAEISQVGLDLLADGYERNWNEGSIDNFKKVANIQRDIINVYKIASHLDYSTEDLIILYEKHIDLLTEKHKKQLVDHFENENQIRETCKKYLGEITGSANREHSKRLPNTALVKKYRNEFNRLVAHSQIDLNCLQGQKLNDYLEQLSNLRKLDRQITEEIKKIDRNSV